MIGRRSMLDPLSRALYTASSPGVVVLGLAADIYVEFCGNSSSTPFRFQEVGAMSCGVLK